MAGSETATFTILDKEYRVACSEQEKAGLMASAKLLNDRILEAKGTGTVAGTERIAIMVALNLAHELLTGESLVNEYSDIEQRIDGLSEKIETTIRQFDREVLPV